MSTIVCVRFWTNNEWRPFPFILFYFRVPASSRLGTDDDACGIWASVSMHSNYYYYLLCALKQLLNFHSHRHRFHRRCHQTCGHNEASTSTQHIRALCRTTLISFEFTTKFWHYDVFHYILLIFKMKSTCSLCECNLCNSKKKLRMLLYTRCAQKTFVGSNFIFASCHMCMHTLHSPCSHTSRVTFFTSIYRQRRKSIESLFIFGSHNQKLKHSIFQRARYCTWNWEWLWAVIELFLCRDSKFTCIAPRWPDNGSFGVDFPHNVEKCCWTFESNAGI